MAHSGSRRAVLSLMMMAGWAGFAGGAEHPGNVYVEGGDVRIVVPPTWLGWSAVGACDPAHDVTHEGGVTGLGGGVCSSFVGS
jgi:hypothetical protein